MMLLLLLLRSRLGVCCGKHVSEHAHGRWRSGRITSPVRRNDGARGGRAWQPEQGGGVRA
jgi:hypothetical protein